MRSFFGIVLFLVVFALVGVATHFAIFSSPGIFIWSLNPERKLVQTRIKAEGPVLVKPPVEEVPKVPPPIEETAPKPAEKEPEAPQVEEQPSPPENPGVISLFNGKDLGKWKVTQYGGEGEVSVTKEGELEFGFGAILTGVNWNENPPRTSNYEVSLDAMKLGGSDFFCALTFPVIDSHATFVVGGWGGGIVGLSSVDDLDASENETMNIEGFNDNVWYRIKVRVTDDKIEAWIDGVEKVNLDLKDRKISLRPGDIELSVPLGISSFQTRSKYRNITWTNLPENP